MRKNKGNKIGKIGSRLCNNTCKTRLEPGVHYDFLFRSPVSIRCIESRIAFDKEIGQY